MYKIIALIGEAGSGKDTIMQEILKRNPNKYHEIISCTTRPIREGEAEGVNYFYLTPEQFADKVLNYEMLEATSFNDWFYGTSYESLRSEVPNIGVFNPDGIRALVGRKDIDLTIYRICCDNKIRLLRQLNREEHPNVDEIIRRYNADKTDFYDLEFNYIEVLNNTKQDLINSVNKIVDFIEDKDIQGQKKLKNQ